MKTGIKMSALLVSLLCVSSLTFAAQNMPPRGPMSFEMCDMDQDGFVTQKEFYDARGKRMEERSNAGMPMRNAGNAPTFESMDTNKDGKLDELEFLKGQNAHMQENRANKGYGPGMK